jgi:UDP-glucose:(heptosyl)LPS alpha-1,3-glucosyltransferase
LPPFSRTRRFSLLFSNPSNNLFISLGCADLRIAVVSPFVDRRHGTERALAELLERLARIYQCEIHLYSQRAEDLTLGQRPVSGTQQEGSIIWHKLPSIPGPHLLQFLFWLVLNAFFRRWDRAIHGVHFDLVLSPGVNCFNADAVIVHALFHRLRGLAREGKEAGESGFLRRFHRRTYYSLMTWLERRIYTSSQVSLAAVSQRTATLLKEYFHRDDVRVIPNGVNGASFSPEGRLLLRAEARTRYNFQETHFVLLLIGNDWRNKGLSTILATMAACYDIPLRLLVAGKDAAGSYFFEEAKRLGLSEQCRSETTPVDAINLYAVADAYVSPTREDAFALPPLEAMACGLPVITSVNNGGSQIITEGTDGFVLSDPRDSAALANLLRRLYQQPDLRRSIGESAARTAQAYTWERNAAETWEFLMSALDNKRRRTART